MRAKSWFFLFSCNLMWALQFTCVKLVQDDVGTIFTVWAPMTLATIMLYPIVISEKKEEFANSPRLRCDLILFLILAALGIFPGQILITWGTRLSLASNAALLMLTLPVCTAIMAYFFLKEKMTRIRWISFGMALAGVLLCGEVDFQNLDFGAPYLLGNLIIFLGLNGSAFYNSYCKKVLQRYTAMEVLFYTYLMMFIILTPMMLIMEGDVFSRIGSFSSNTWIGFVLLTFFHNWLSMVLFLKALQRLDAIQAALSNYLITFFGVPIAALWLGERLNPAAIIGGIIILASTLLITLNEETGKQVQS